MVTRWRRGSASAGTSAASSGAIGWSSPCRQPLRYGPAHQRADDRLRSRLDVHRLVQRRAANPLLDEGAALPGDDHGMQLRKAAGLLEHGRHAPAVEHGRSDLIRGGRASGGLRRHRPRGSAAEKYCEREAQAERCHASRYTGTQPASMHTGASGADHGNGMERKARRRGASPRHSRHLQPRRGPYDGGLERRAGRPGKPPHLVARADRCRLPDPRGRRGRRRARLCELRPVPRLRRLSADGGAFRLCGGRRAAARRGERAGQGAGGARTRAGHARASRRHRGG